MKPTLPRSYFPAMALALTLYLPSLSLPVQAQQTLGIAAVVNEEVISLYDLQSRISLLIATSNQEDTPERRKRYTGQVLNQLINEKLQIQEAERLGITISDEEKERSFNTLARNNQMNPKQLETFLKDAGVEKEMLIDQLHAQMAWGRAVNRKFRSEISIGNDEVDEIISEISKSKGKPEYLVAEIFIPVDLPENIEKQRQSANLIISQLKNGANFSVLARNFSQSATAAVGGNLGWIRQGQLEPALETAIASLADGQLSQPVQTVAGFYILLRRKSRIGQGLNTGDEAVELYQVYRPLPPAPSPQDVNAGLAAAAKSTAEASSCDEMSEIGKQTGSPLSGSLGKVKVSSLPPQTRNLINDLEIGKPAQPIRSGDGIIVLMVCDRTGKTSLSEIRKNIEASLLDKRLDGLARRLLRDLRRTAFLDIRI